MAAARRSPSYAGRVSGRPIPTPSLVVLIGPPASGKSSWAHANFRPEQIVGADDLRAIVGEHALDLGATDDAFDLLDRIVALRLGRGLTTVVDTTGLDPTRRRAHLDRARASGVTAVAVRFTTSAAECRRRNRERSHPVPARALDTMIAKARHVDLDDEGWDLVIAPEPVRVVARRLADAVGDVGTTGSAPEMSRRALRFGLMVSDLTWATTDELGPALRHLAHDAERVGFESIWVMDHLIQIPQVGRRWDPVLDAWTTLAHLAAVTERIRLGVLVSPITFRHVVVLAKAVATLDVLSEGRAMVGIGAGSSEQEHHALGIPFAPPAERLAVLRDVARALPILFGPGGTPFEGDRISIPDTSLYPRPIQDRVPVVVGGSGEQVTLRIAAEHADGCNLFGEPATVARRVGVLRDHCAAVGRDPDDVEVSHLGTVLVGADAIDVRNRIERARPASVGPDRFAERVGAGTVDDHADRFRAFADAGVDLAVVSVADLGTPGALDPFEELIARFA